MELVGDAVILALLFICVDGQNKPVYVRSDARPPSDVWPLNYVDRQNGVLMDWLLEGCWSLNESSPCSHAEFREVEYEGYDGFYNNIARPDLGAVDRPLLRRWPASYEDSTYKPSGSKRPNPFELSDRLLSGETGTRSRTGKNALLVFFGQQVVEEILDAQRPACPPEYFNIPIPDSHPYRKTYGHTQMPFLRTRFDQRTGHNPNNPRQQLNEITPFLDGGLFYGTTKQWADQLRTYSDGTVDPDGRLASSHGGLFPEYNTARLPMANPPSPFYHAAFIENHETEKVDRFFKLGNPRGNENTFLLTFGVLWFRWHNLLAESLRRHHPTWSSEQIFNEARKWTIATYQHVVYDEWLPTWLNTSTLAPYSKYDPAVDPQIDQFFQSAAFRFGHTLVVPGVYIRDYGRNNCNSRFESWGRNSVRTCNAFWRPQEAILAKVSEEELVDIDRILMGMSVQLCEEEDHRIVEDLRRNVFGPLEFPRRDLMAVNIQRGRDHGLPDFNTARKAYGLPSVGFEHFSGIVKNKTIIDNLRMLYGNKTDDIDPWVGGILETGDGPGEFFQAVIIDQFRRIRDGDRFWYENRANNLFSDDDVIRIKQLSIYDIIMAATKMDHYDIPKFPFKVPSTRKTQSSGTVLPEDDAELIRSCQLTQSQCQEREKSVKTFDCYHLPLLDAAALNESCVQGQSFDYFYKSEASFILTLIFLSGTIAGAAGLVYALIKTKEKRTTAACKARDETLRKSLGEEKHTLNPIIPVNEWIGHKQPLRPVVLVLNGSSKQIQVMTQRGSLLRVVDLAAGFLHVYKITDQPYLLLKSAQDYDLVVAFETETLREMFYPQFKKFIDEMKIEKEYVENFTLKAAMKIVVSKVDRQKRLDKFFRVLFAQAFGIEHNDDELLNVDSDFAKEVLKTELTLNEFAEAMKMHPKNDFVQKIFQLTDKDKNNFISFKEFADLLVVLAAGDEEAKAELMFKIYDVNNIGKLTKSEFIAMIKSFLETVGGDVDQDALNKTIEDMMRKKGLAGKREFDLGDFKQLLGENIRKLSKVKLEFAGNLGQSATERNEIQSIYGTADEIRRRFEGNTRSIKTDHSLTREKGMLPVQTTKFKAARKYVQKNSKKIFWTVLYTLVLWAIFAERAYYYSVEREHSGLRRIAGYGVTITRGAASAMMFTYSSLLLTMCRNTITYLRDTFLNNYIPFDSSVDFHKYIAYWALVFTIMHIIGHAFNFYHISTQTADDLTCLFRNFFHSTHQLPKFHYWCWQTMTGFTGVVLTVLTAVIFLFAQPIGRRKIYNFFWYTHSLYPIFYIFMVLHGTGRLIQEPFFYYFFSGPVAVFAVDTVISASRKKIEIPVVHAEILPSNVTMLEFKKPENFEYKSGQWVRIACLGLNKNEFHPFTLSSSPNEDNLTVHIRAVGPWTMHIRNLYDDTITSEQQLPKIYLDGPYGEGHQDWKRYEVSILIGGGIGVTPFASILKDVIYSSQTKCKKVYFVWVSRTQKQFEWLIDLLRQLEEQDKRDIIRNHIFITQFYKKFDLRTVLLYIFETHYQRISEKSLFTNLKGVTHFGRPNFPVFFKTVQTLNPKVRTVGVFSCGPASMTNVIDEACVRLNKSTNETAPSFEHHYKNF